MTQKQLCNSAKDSAKPPRIISENGDLFIVMRGDRRIALGLITRGGKRAGKLGYFFDVQLYDKTKDISDLFLEPKQSIWIAKFGDLHILRGKWPIVGKLKGFTRHAWPMPVFLRHNESFDIKYICTYDEDDVTKGLEIWRDDQVPEHVNMSIIAEDGAAGAGYVEEYLTKIVGL